MANHRPCNIGKLVEEKKRDADFRFAQFVELLSEHDAAAGNPGGCVKEVCKRIGMPRASGIRYLRRLKDEMGPQASG